MLNVSLASETCCANVNYLLKIVKWYRIPTINDTVPSNPIFDTKIQQKYDSDKDASQFALIHFTIIWYIKHCLLTEGVKIIVIVVNYVWKMSDLQQFLSYLERLGA